MRGALRVVVVPGYMDARTPLFVSIVCCIAFTASGSDVIRPQASRERARVENFALLDHLGRFQELYYYSDARGIVLFVQGNDCLIARDSLPALRQAAKDFEDQNVVFLMINANLQDDRESIASEARDYGIDFPILVDEAQLIAESLDLSRTAEVLVIDPASWQIVYRGPLDDRRGYGTRRETASRHYLSEALAALLAGDAVDIDAPPAQGCLISLPGQDRENNRLISYVDDVAPILEKHCVSCHRAGGIAPWTMDSYESVRGWSAMIGEVVRTKRMPPWHADPHVGRLANDNSLTSEEVRALTHWIEAGASRGEGPDPLKDDSAPQVAEWPLGPPDIILDGEPQEIPATGIIPYQYTSMNSPLEEDVWIRAAHLKPSNPKVLHHALAFVRYPRDADRASQGRSSDTIDLARTNFARRRGGRFFERIFAKFNPGQQGDVFPAGTGRFLPAGSSFRIQLHYTPTGRAESDTPRLGLYLSKLPPDHELKITAAINTRFEIPPNTRLHEVAAERAFDRDVIIYSMQPHMHYRGRQMSFEALFPDGSTELLLSVPSYDFDYQRIYELEEPRHLPAGTRIRCRGAFDNSPQNEANPDPSKSVRWGLQSTDEMFIGYLVYTEADSEAVRPGRLLGE